MIAHERVLNFMRNPKLARILVAVLVYPWRSVILNYVVIMNNVNTYSQIKGTL